MSCYFLLAHEGNGQSNIFRFVYFCFNNVNIDRWHFFMERFKPQLIKIRFTIYGSWIMNKNRRNSIDNSSIQCGCYCSHGVYWTKKKEKRKKFIENLSSRSWNDLWKINRPNSIARTIDDDIFKNERTTEAKITKQKLMMEIK